MTTRQTAAIALAALVLGAALVASSAAWGLMPPHVRKTEPANGGVLQGRTIVVHGYTLNGSYGTAKVVALGAKGQATPVPVTTQRDCKTVGRGDCAGCRQRKCVLNVTLAWTRAGQRYRFSMLDTTVTFTAAKTLGKAPATKAPPTKAPPTKAPPVKAPRRSAPPRGSKPGSGSGSGPSRGR